MATLHETAYPRLKPDPTAKELEEIYTPTAAEIAFAKQLTTQPGPQLAVLIHLKLFQRLGYFTLLADVPERIRKHIAKAARLGRVLDTDQLERYDASGSQRRHMPQLRQFIGVRPLDKSGLAWLDTVATGAAQTKHTIPDIVNVLLEELVHHRYELPGFRTLELAAIGARERVNLGYYRSISHALTPAQARARPAHQQGSSVLPAAHPHAAAVGRPAASHRCAGAQAQAVPCNGSGL
jgi:hypothetical protein